MNKKTIDIGDTDLDVYIYGQLVLHIGQVSDNEVINLFLYPKNGNILESIIHQEHPDNECTHELLCNRKSVKK